MRKLKNGYRIVCEECGGSSHYTFIQPWHDNKFVAQCQAAKAWNSRFNVPRTTKSKGQKPDCFYNDNGSDLCLGLSANGMDEPIEQCKKCWYCESGYRFE